MILPSVGFASPERSPVVKIRQRRGKFRHEPHYTDVWVMRDGRWQAVASHGTRFDKGH